jgi:hypothetical protein
MNVSDQISHAGSALLGKVPGFPLVLTTRAGLDSSSSYLRPALCCPSDSIFHDYTSDDPEAKAPARSRHPYASDCTGHRLRRP